MCWKTWTDLMISLPNKKVKWCCKTLYTEQQSKELTFDLDTLNLDFLVNHPILQKRKKDLSSGVKSEDCKTCWLNEQRNGMSTRLVSKKDISSIMLDTKFQNIDNYSETVSNLDYTTSIELELTNKCNMACAYCWEGLSSRWQKETGIRFPDTEDLIFDKVINVLSEYWDTKLKNEGSISFLLQGGEPFFTNHMFEFIERFIKNINDTKRKQQKVTLVITTNLNFPESKLDRFIELVKSTENITYVMQLSGEAIGKQSELIRWGLDWDKWEKNLLKFVKESKYIKNLHIGFGCAHNSLSIPYFKQFLEYIDNVLEGEDYNKPIFYHKNWIDTPEHLSPSVLESKYKSHIDEMIEYLTTNTKSNIFGKNAYIESLRTIKSLIGTNNNNEMKEFSYQKFSMLEQRRGISFAEHFPHYSELILKPSK